jgi:hypothetical protein
MDLIGKYLGVWMSEHAARLTFGISPHEPIEGPWIISGQVRYETPGIGLWMTTETVMGPGGKSVPIGDSAGKAVTLIRWQSVDGAIMADERKDVTRPRFFQTR